MNWSISTGCLVPLPWWRFLPHLRRAGFAGLEWVIGPEALWWRPERIGEAVRRAGLRVFSVHPPFAKFGPWANEGEALARQVRLSAAVGAPLTLIHPPQASDWRAPSARRWRRGLEAGLALAGRLGVRVAIETAGRRWRGDAQRLLLAPEDLAAFVEEWDLGVVLDVTHVGSLDPTLALAEPLIGPRLAGIHLSDMGHAAEDWGRGTLGRFASTHRLPGEGILPLRALLARLEGMGFAGPVTLEVSPVHLAVWRPRELERRLRDAVHTLQDGWQRPEAEHWERNP
ncbi:MAG: sugar phosphate isomerase/epimerase [Anaerolineae bacterium]|nr:sugar phosphate isomerase/epimerase [Anaerolineae bacterium]